MILALLLGLLGTFLQWLFMQWLNSFDEAPPPEKLMEMKQKFLNKVSWRFWLGGDRLEKASKLYDKAVAKYSAPQFIGSRDELYGKKDAKNLAASLVDGLSLED